MVAKLLIARSFARLLPLAEHKLCGPMDAVPGSELKENLNPNAEIDATGDKWLGLKANPILALGQ
jgi:hypothetical protein